MLSPVIKEKLILMGADIVSDLIMDIYNDMKKTGKDVLTAEEVLEYAQKWKTFKDVEVQMTILGDRIVYRRDETSVAAVPSSDDPWRIDFQKR